jgi:uncharacterized protein (UPF0332 family)
MILPDEFLTLAETWVPGQSEGEWRSAISRAYFAAFHVATDLLTGIGFQVPYGPQAHAFLWLRLSNCGDPVTCNTGSDLNSLQRWRNKADYDFSHSLTQPTAQAWVRTAHQVIERLRQANVDPVRSQITAAIRDYERNVLRHVTWQGP